MVISVSLLYLFEGNSQGKGSQCLGKPDSEADPSFSLGDCKYIRMCIHVCVEARGPLMVLFYRSCPPCFLSQNFPPVWSLPSRLGLMSGHTQGSVSAWPVLGLQVYITIAGLLKLNFFWCRFWGSNTCFHSLKASTLLTIETPDVGDLPSRSINIVILPWQGYVECEII